MWSSNYSPVPRERLENTDQLNSGLF
jgi:hypothetical protein